MKKATVIILGFGALLVFCLIFFICKQQGLFSKQQNKVSPVTVQTAFVITKDIPIYIDAFGSFAASQDVNINFQVTGYVNKIYFKDGTVVKKGDLLITLNPEVYEATLKKDIATLESDVADFKLKKFYVEKNLALAKIGALAAQTYEAMKIDYAKAIAKVKQDEACILQDKLNLKYCSLYSPIDGIIGFRQAYVGTLIDPSTSHAVANIKAIDPLLLNFTVSEVDIARIEKALNLGTLSLNVYVSEKTEDGIIKENKYQGELKYLNNTADSTSGTVTLQAIVPNPNKTLLPGQFGKVKLFIGEKKDALLVPQSAVRQGPDGAYVFIVGSDSKAKMMAIATGQEYENFYVLEKGDLKAGDRTITTGLLDMVPETPILPQNK